MQQNELFNRTRLRLSLWYAGVMGVILSLSAVGVYGAIAHAHVVALERELDSVARTIHNSLESKLEQPGQVNFAARRLLSDICVRGSACFTQINTNSRRESNCKVSKPLSSAASRYTLSITGQGNYYLRLLDLQGCLIAFAGMPPEDQSFPVFSRRQIFQDKQNTKYHQMSYTLHTLTGQEWGYMQIGRSFREFDDYLATVRWFLGIGLPITLILVGGSSWWLAGLAMRPLYQSYRQIQQFTADAAHELRTPLAAVQATVESALRMPQLDTTEAREVLTAVDRQNRRLTGLVQDLLLLSRLERQSVEQYRQSCCLNDIVSDLAEELAALAVSAQISLTLDERVEQPLYVMGDLDRLYRLVSNLIVNAIQYTPTEGKVEIILDRSDDFAWIEVRDTGIGIAASEQKRIFDRFYRVNSDRSRQTGGAGLGLAIANAIAMAHQGSIEVQSELSQGSVFTIKLPLLKLTMS